jgi:hypothetical protein
MLIDPFHEVLEEFKIQTDSISLGDLDDILEKLFERLHEMGLSTFHEHHRLIIHKLENWTKIKKFQAI